MNLEKRQRIKALVCWILFIITTFCVLFFQYLYVSRDVLDLLFTFTVAVICFGIRGLYQETKDTMLAEMGVVELSALKAQIEQVIKARGEKP